MKQLVQFFDKVFLCQITLNQLFDNFLVHYKVHQRDKLHLDKPFGNEVGETIGFVAHHLRHREQSRFERGRSRGHQCRAGVLEQVVGLVLYQEHVGLADNAFVKTRFDRRNTRNNKLIFRKMRCHIKHNRQHSLHFLGTAPRQEGDDFALLAKAVAT